MVSPETDGAAGGADAPAAEEKVSKSVVQKKYAQKYGATRHTGDEIGTALAAFVLDDKKVLDLDKLAQVATANGIDLSKYASRNRGMQRMTVGNILRGLHNKGQEVTIGDTKIVGAAKS